MHCLVGVIFYYSCIYDFDTCSWNPNIVIFIAYAIHNFNSLAFQMDTIYMINSMAAWVRTTLHSQHCCMRWLIRTWNDVLWYTICGAFASAIWLVNSWRWQDYDSTFNKTCKGAQTLFWLQVSVLRIKMFLNKKGFWYENILSEL